MAGPLVTATDQPVESLQAGLVLRLLHGVAEDGAGQQRQPGDSLHRQHQEGVEGERLAGLTRLQLLQHLGELTVFSPEINVRLKLWA